MSNTSKLSLLKEQFFPTIHGGPIFFKIQNPTFRFEDNIKLLQEFSKADSHCLYLPQHGQ